MTSVQTIRGPVDVHDLGVTLMHEHVLLIDKELELNQPGTWRQSGGVEAARAKLRAARAHGVDTLVDLTVLGLGRDVELVREVVDSVDLNVVIATGVYTFDEVPRYFRHRGPGTIGSGPEIMTEFFVRDIDVGVADTDVRAGILKCATDARGVTPGVDRVLRAVAAAHRATGVPISTHTDAATRRGLDQQHVLRSEGVDLSRVVIGHCGDTTDIDYLTALMDAGSYIGMDRFGLDDRLSTADRVATIAELTERGYADRIVLSHDTSCFTHTYDDALRQQHYPDWRYDFVPRTVAPMLMDAGVTEKDVTRMLVENPIAVFANQRTY